MISSIISNLVFAVAIPGVKLSPWQDQRYLRLTHGLWSVYFTENPCCTEDFYLCQCNTDRLGDFASRNAIVNYLWAVKLGDRTFPH
jgi:hypothetical protein